jgi:hypothetical protein
MRQFRNNVIRAESAYHLTALLRVSLNGDRTPAFCRW